MPPKRLTRSKLKNIKTLKTMETKFNCTQLYLIRFEFAERITRAKKDIKECESEDIKSFIQNALSTYIDIVDKCNKMIPEGIYEKIDIESL